MMCLGEREKHFLFISEIDTSMKKKDIEIENKNHMNLYLTK